MYELVIKWRLIEHFARCTVCSLSILSPPSTPYTGVGRLLAEASLTPIVIPFYHIGMDSILPNRSPYIPHFFQVLISLVIQRWSLFSSHYFFVQKLTVLVGNPIDFSVLIAEQRRLKASAVVTRKLITDRLQDKMMELRTQAEVMHQQWVGSS